MDDILYFVSWLFNTGWSFMKLDVPGMPFSFGVLTIGILLISLGFRFLSIIMGHNIGEAEEGAKYASRASKKYRISKERAGDVR